MDRFEPLFRRACAIASLHRPHPNPRVGALVVSPEGVILGEGAHVEPGTPHAEPLALAAAGVMAKGATMVVTLEPHAHFGRTPPCTDAIIEAGITRVVVGRRDPNPEVSGKGVDRLKAAGIEILEPSSEAVLRLDPGYFHRWEKGLPRVTLKTASTLDGQTATATGQSRWITSEAARRDVHRLRSESDGVMIGAGTVIQDDPVLDVRIPGFEGKQPRPVIVAGEREIPDRAKIWNRDPVVLSRRPLGKNDEIICEDLEQGLRGLIRLGLFDILAEGGASLNRSLISGGLVAEGVSFIAGAVAGGTGLGVFAGSFGELSSMLRVEIVDVARFGPDLRVRWIPEP